MDRLVPLVYEDLRQIARAQLRRRLPGQSLDTTGLVHEAYLRLVDQTRASWQDRGHFFAVCAVAMRRILIDRARTRACAKRGGGNLATPIDGHDEPAVSAAEQLLDLEVSLGKLASVDRRLVRVVECRYFAGLSERETAEALGVSVRTAQREWLKARAWLRAELGKGRP